MEGFQFVCSCTETCGCFYNHPAFDTCLSNDVQTATTLLTRRVIDIMDLEKAIDDTNDLSMVLHEAYSLQHPDPVLESRIMHLSDEIARCEKRFNEMPQSGLSRTSATTFWIQRYREDSGRDFASASEVVFMVTPSRAPVFAPLALRTLVEDTAIAETDDGSMVCLAPRWLAEVWVEHLMYSPMRNLTRVLPRPGSAKSPTLVLAAALCSRMDASDAIAASEALTAL